MIEWPYREKDSFYRGIIIYDSRMFIACGSYDSQMSNLFKILFLFYKKVVYNV